MAIQATAVYEVNNLLGNIDNPGGYDGTSYPGGTDKSQGAVVHSATDWAIDAVDNTKITSGTYSFVADDVGNSIRVTAGVGFTIGTYYVTAVTGGAAVLDRAVGTTGSTGGTARFGGAVSTPANSSSLTTATVVAGNNVWMKETGTPYSDGANNWTLNLSGTAANRVYVSGYGTTRGDGVKAVYNGSNNRSWQVTGAFLVVRNILWDGNGATGSATFANTNDHNLFINVEVTDAPLVPSNTGTRCYFFGCRFHHQQAGVAGLSCGAAGGAPNQGVIFEHCEFDHNPTAGVSIGDGGAYEFRNCLCHHNQDGFLFANGSRYGAQLVNCTLADNTRDGIRADGTENALGNTSFRNFFVHRSIFADNAGYDVNWTAGWADVSGVAFEPWMLSNWRHNAFYTTGTDTYNRFRGNALEDIVLSANPFVDAGTFDYTLNSDAGGGADLRSETAQAVAFSGATSYPQFGAVASQSVSVPIAPTSLTAVEGVNGVVLAWVDNSTNEDGFVIERKVGAGAFSVIHTTTNNTTTYTDATALPATEYTYRVKASNVSGSSSYSNEATLTTLPTGSGVPTAPDIDEVRFPPDISRGAVGGDMFVTIVVAGSTGVEQRNENWDVPRMTWDVSHGLRTPTQGRELKSFWLCRRGRSRGFRFKNWDDYTVTDEALTPTGSKTVQLTKTYSDGVFSFVKTIFKPTEDTTPFTMRRNGGSFTGFTLDDTTGIVTLTPDASFTISGITQATQAVITATGHTFSVGQTVYIEGVNGMTGINGRTVVIVGVGVNTLTVALDTTGFAAYTAGGTVAKYVQPNEVLDWSGEFDIPCRFDTDQMRLSLADSEIREWNSIPIVELIA